MPRKVDLALWIIAASLCSHGVSNVAAQTAAAPVVAQTKADTLEAAITRASELLQRAAALGEDAAKQKAALEALRSRAADEKREQGDALVARGKELEQARAELVSLQKQVGEIRAATTACESVQRRHTDVTKELEAKEAELVTLRAQSEKLQTAIVQERKVCEQAVTAAQKGGQQKAEASAGTTVSEKPSAVAVAPVAGAEVAAPASPPTTEPAAVAPPPPADGTAIKKWQQADGSLYFGERPQPGSKFLGYTTGGGL